MIFHKGMVFLTPDKQMYAIAGRYGGKIVLVNVAADKRDVRLYEHPALNSEVSGGFLTLHMLTYNDWKEGVMV